MFDNQTQTQDNDFLPSSVAIFAELNDSQAQSESTQDGALSVFENTFNDGDMVRVSADLLLDLPMGNIRKTRKNKPDMVESVKLHGIIQPVLARPHPVQAGYFELLAGYGRRDIARELAIEIPVLVRLVDDKQAMLMHLAENKDRSDIEFGDEVRFVRQWLSLFHGDRASALSASGWSATKFNERAELLKATPEVLDALDDAAITVRHALILASFDATVQNNTLKKVIDEKWSLETLRQRADKVQVPLSLAIFDKAECLSNCPHNTQLQANLFDFGDVESKCAKSSCFKAKTDAELANRRALAEERYGRVILLSESVAGDRVTVTADAVGAEQFNSGCGGCSDKVVVLNDKIGTGTGSIEADQCANKDCYTKCVATHKASLQPAKESKKPASPKATGGADSQPVTTEKAATPKEKAAPKTEGFYTQSAKEAHQVELRDNAAAHLAQTPIFAQALQVFALINLVGVSTNKRGSDLLASLMQKTPEELASFQAAAIEHALTKSKSFASVNAWEFLTAAAKATPTGAAELQRLWEPTKATMDKYTTTQLEVLGKNAGLDAHNPDGFKKASAGRKADLVDFIIKAKETGFDWSGYAPAPYITEMNKR